MAARLMLALATASAAKPQTADAPDPLWLRYEPVPNASLYSTIRSVAVRADAATCQEDKVALQGIADELSTALSGLLGRDVPSACCCAGDVAEDDGAVTVAVDAAALEDGGASTVAVDAGAKFAREGYAVERARVEAATASGAWYGAFKLLSYVQRRLPLPERDASAPAMELRAWNLWDTLSGVVERGNAGNSLVWPYALYDDDNPPHPAQLYVATACNSYLGLRLCSSSPLGQNLQWQLSTVAIDGSRHAHR